MPEINKLKRFLIFMVIIISVASIASCSSFGGKSSDYSSKGMSGIDNSKEALLKFYFKGSQYFTYSKENNVRKMLGEVESRSKQALNVSLDFEWINDSDYVKKIKELLNSGDNFDAFVLDTSFNAQELFVDNLVLNLAELMPQYAPEYYKKFSKDAIDSLKYKGNLFIIPCYRPYSSRMCVMARQDLIDKYNIPDIKDYNDYENYLKLIKENEKELIPGCISSQSKTDAIFAESYGYFNAGNYIVGKWNQSNISLIPWEQAPEYHDAVGTINYWLKNEYIKISDNTNMINDIVQNSNDKIASYLCPGYFISYFNSNEKQIFKVYPLYMDKLSAAMPISANGIAISKKSKNANRVIEFVEWLQNSQENYDLFMYGIKDENYELKGENIVLNSYEKRIAGWPGYLAFYNIDYDRTNIYQQSDFKEIYKKCMESNVTYSPMSILYNRIQSNGTASEIDKKLVSIKSRMNEREKDIAVMEKSLVSVDINKQINDFIESQKKLEINEVVEQYIKAIKELAK